MGLLDIDIHEEPKPFKPEINLDIVREIDAISRRETYKEVPYKERRCDKKIKYKKTRLH